MKSPEQLKKETRESAAAKEKAKANMYLTGGQARIAAKAPPPNKINEKDFAVLRAEKAKGRGMGLQDEKVKPGKVMKAKRGRLAGKDLTERMKNVERGLINKATGKPTSMDAMRKLKGFKPGESSADFNKRRMELARAKDVAKALGPRGKIALGVGLAGVGAVQYLKSKMKKKDEPKKKMGGGMMKRPMGYKKGMSIKGDDKRDIRKTESMIGASKSSPREKAIKKMGGGMMQKPMGYREGMGPEAGTPRKKQRRSGPAAGRPGTRSGLTPGLGSLTGRQTSKFKDTLDKAKRYKRAGDAVEANFNVAIAKRRRTGKKPFSDKKSASKFFNELESSSTRESAARMMSGGMTKPMGYKSGTSVKVKCKLGRNKPTKMY
tara:strand:- start:98 stop:1228 length:1131 start_codon:yes stop_codon:yes gene_type:complete